MTPDRTVTSPSSGRRCQVPGLQPTPVAPWLTILSSMFMHAGIAHILGNMLYLLIFGDNVEDRLGHLRHLLFYLFCGLRRRCLLVPAVASLSHVYTTLGRGGSLMVPSLGASGAVSGVLGAHLLLFPRKRVRVLMFHSIVEVPALLGHRQPRPRCR